MGKHSGKRVPPRKRGRVIAALANGEPVIRIAKREHMSQSTVAAIQTLERVNVDERKRQLVEQAESNAFTAGIQITEALEQRLYTPSALVPVYGVSLDKALALRGDPITVRHEHLHAELTPDNLRALIRERSTHAQTVPVPSLPDSSQVATQPDQKPASE